MKTIFFATLIAPLLLCASCKDDTSGSTPSYPDQIPTTDKFPVVAWHGVRSSHASIERFKEAEQMGITLNYSRMQNVQTALKMLDMAAETNVKLFVEIDELYKENERPAAVRALMNHPALAGYFLADEPAPSAFPDLAVRMKDVQRLDKEHICYSNLLPTGGPEHYAALGVKDYREYVTRYLNEVPVTFVSFDCYPIVSDNNGLWVKAEWYEALEVTADEARKRNMDLWAFLLTTPHVTYPVPTHDQLRLQAYSNLAYGAQVLQCFTYWTPSVSQPEVWNYRNGPLEEDGSRSATYDVVKNLLTEVQQIAWIFRGSKVEGVWHLKPGSKVPVGTKELTTLPAMANEIMIPNGEEALVSVITNHGYTFMIVQNTSIRNNTRAVIKMKDGVRYVDHSGKVTLAAAEKDIQVITPGDIRIYMW